MPSPEQTPTTAGYAVQLVRNHDDWEWTLYDPEGVRISGGFTFDGTAGPKAARDAALSEARAVAVRVAAAAGTPYPVGHSERIAL